MCLLLLLVSLASLVAAQTIGVKQYLRVTSISDPSGVVVNSAKLLSCQTYSTQQLSAATIITLSPFSRDLLPASDDGKAKVSFRIDASAESSSSSCTGEARTGGQLLTADARFNSRTSVLTSGFGALASSSDRVISYTVGPAGRNAGSCLQPTRLASYTCIDGGALWVTESQNDVVARFATVDDALFNQYAMQANALAMSAPAPWSVVPPSSSGGQNQDEVSGTSWRTTPVATWTDKAPPFMSPTARSVVSMRRAVALPACSSATLKVAFLGTARIYINGNAFVCFNDEGCIESNSGDRDYELDYSDAVSDARDLRDVAAFLVSRTLTVDSSWLNANGSQQIAVAFHVTNSTSRNFGSSSSFSWPRVPFALSIVSDNPSCSPLPPPPSSVSMVALGRQPWQYASEPAYGYTTVIVNATTGQTRQDPVFNVNLRMASVASNYVGGNVGGTFQLLQAFPGSISSTLQDKAVVFRTNLTLRSECASRSVPVSLSLYVDSWHALVIDGRSVFCGPSSVVGCRFGLPSQILSSSTRLSSLVGLAPNGTRHSFMAPATIALAMFGDASTMRRMAFDVVFVSQADAALCGGSCGDNIQNGGELGVDCGPSCGKPCTAPTPAPTPTPAPAPTPRPTPAPPLGTPTPSTPAPVLPDGRAPTPTPTPSAATNSDGSPATEGPVSCSSVTMCDRCATANGGTCQFCVDTAACEEAATANNCSQPVRVAAVCPAANVMGGNVTGPGGFPVVDENAALLPAIIGGVLGGLLLAILLILLLLFVRKRRNSASASGGNAHNSVEFASAREANSTAMYSGGEKNSQMYSSINIGNARNTVDIAAYGAPAITNAPLNPAVGTYVTVPSSPTTSEAYAQMDMHSSYGHLTLGNE